jgi:hypothetical protein
MDEINKFKTFKFDEQNNRAINLKSNEGTNTDEYLEIQFILNNNYIQREYAPNFETKIIK